MKNILISWLDSLALLKPHNFINFIQIVIKSWIALCWTMVKNFWWLFIGALILLLIKMHWILFTALVILWLLLIILAVRPSLKRKDLYYFSENLIYGFPLLIIFAIPCCLPMEIVYGVAPWLVLTMLFLCDSGVEPMRMMMSPVHAFVMALKKLPIYLIFVGLFYLCSFLPWLATIFIAVPLLVAMLSCCYTIWTHTNYKAYYEGHC